MPTPSASASATSHSSRAHAQAASHHWPEARHGPEAASTRARFLSNATEAGTAKLTCTVAFKTGRNTHSATVGALFGKAAPFSEDGENLATRKAQGWCESTSCGEPTRAVPFASISPTTP